MIFGNSKKSRGEKTAPRSGRNSRMTNSAAKSKVKTLRSVPTVPMRKGTNSAKDKEVKSQRHKIRNAGFLKRTLRLVKSFLVILLIVGGLGALGFAGYQVFERNGFLVLREVTVVGNHLLSKSAILEKAGLELGVKLPSVPVGQIEAAISTLPGLGQVEVRRIFPSRIEIRIKEKIPVAMGYEKGWFGLGPDGSTISGLNWSESDLPIVDAFATMDSTHRAALGGFLETAKAGYPDIYADISQICLQKNSDVMEIVLRDGRMKVLMEIITTSNGSKSLNSLEFLQALKEQQSASLETAKVLDLRVEGYAYVH